MENQKLFLATENTEFTENSLTIPTLFFPLRGVGMGMAFI